MVDKTIKVRAKLIELWSRLVEFDKESEIYNNGHDNLYPNEMERVVGNSPTANRSSIMLSKYIAGLGIEGEDIIVNKKKGLRLTHIIKDISDSISVQNGFYIHIGYGLGDNGDYIPNKLEVLDYIRCRIGKEDDNDYAGRIFVGDWEKEQEAKSTLSRRIGRKSSTSKDDQKKRWFYPYNPDQKVVEAQIQADGKDLDTAAEKIQAYRGQVLYVNLTPNVRYALSKFDGVFNDCDTEYRMSLYANTITRGGFLGKIAVLTQGLDEDTANKVVDDVKQWLGAENSQDVYHLDVEQAESLENVLKIIQIDSQFDDDMFVNTDKRLRRNITGAANNIPEPLIYASDGALFGTSGDAYREMKEFYNEQTRSERVVIEQTFTKLGFEVKIVPLVEEERVDKELDGEKTDEEEEITPNPDENDLSNSE